MAYLIASREQTGRAVASANGRLLRRTKPIINTDTTNWIIRYTFYAFVFSLPFEEAYVTGGTTLTKLFGVALAAFALLQPRLCYKFPPKAVWAFAIYLVVFAAWGLHLVIVPPDVPEFPRSFVTSLFRLGQLLFLFWISYNLMRQERVINGALWALTAATILLALLQLAGVTSDVSRIGRVSAFDANPNSTATVLSLGLLALFGLAYGRAKNDWKGRAIFWLSFGVLGVALVQTGSRGALVALVAGLSVFFLRGKSLAAKLKFGLIALAGVIVLIVVSYRIDTVRVRWEQTFYDQSLAGRERIYPEAIGIILERPLVGWGPIVHNWELGSRLGLPYRDEHNVYLYILAEAGLLGAIPFFAGLWLCVRAAWRARQSIQGILPLVMLLFILTASMKGTFHNRKYFWVVLSFALASATYVAPRPGMQLLRAVPKPYRRQLHVSKSTLSKVREQKRQTLD